MRREKGAQLQWEEEPTRQLSLQPVATGALVVGNFYGRSPSVQKVAEKAIGERAGHNMSERRVSLEKRNVNAELVPNKRRPPPSLWEASDKSTAEEHRGNGDSMCAKEGCVSTGSLIFLRKCGLDSCFLVEVNSLAAALKALW